MGGRELGFAISFSCSIFFLFLMGLGFQSYRYGGVR